MGAAMGDSIIIDESVLCITHPVPFLYYNGDFAPAYGQIQRFGVYLAFFLDTYICLVLR